MALSKYTFDTDDSASANCLFSHNDVSDGKSQTRPVPSYWKVDSHHGYLCGYDKDNQHMPFMVMTKILSFKRNKHDREYFSIEYGTENLRLNCFLRILDQENADRWEDVLCKLTKKQLPPGRRRTNTNTTSSFRGRSVCGKNTYSGPSSHGGFKVVSIVEEEGDSENASKGGKKFHRDGQREPTEGHLRDVVGAENVSKTPSPSNSQRNSDESMEARVKTDDVLNEASEKLKTTMSAFSPLSSRDEQPASSSSSLLPEPLMSAIQANESASRALESYSKYLRNLRSNRDQDYIELSFHKECLIKMYPTLKGTEWGFFLTKLNWNGCESCCDKGLNIGDRFLQVNEQKLISDESFIHFVVSSAKDEVKIKLESFPRGTLVCLEVTSRSKLGIEHIGNEITRMDPDKALRPILDPLRVWTPSGRSTRSITAINEHAVHFDATTKVVDEMLDREIGRRRFLILQLHPTEFLRRLDPTAADSRAFAHEMENDEAALNLRYVRRPSVPLDRKLRAGKP